MKFKSKKGFTLIELLVVIVIIGILATLATVALSAAKVKARDAKRISDIKQMQTALELYYNEESTYPPTAALAAGQALVGAVSGKTFMGKIPAGPSSGETYTYNQINGGTSYTLGYVLEKPVNEFAAGAAVALPGSINNQCTPNCSGKCDGSDGCGGICSNSCSGGTPYCKSDGITCVACIINSNCSGGKICSSGYCVTDFSPACTSGTALGSACGGGWLICKPSDGNCADSPSNYVVVAPADLTVPTTIFTWANAGTTCASYHNTGDNNGTWSLPKLSSVSATTLSGNRINNEMCQMMKRSNICDSMTTSGSCNVSTLCSGLSNAEKPISLNGSYWSLTEYDSTNAWFQRYNGSQEKVTKFGEINVRCVRRFN